MKMTNEIAKLICDLEYNIGNQCYNPKSYDGWTGVEGCEFRYPVHFRDAGEECLTKTRRNITLAAERITPDTVSSMKYVLGANHLFIGLGIKDLLEALEERYGIDFNKMEAEVNL